MVRGLDAGEYNVFTKELWPLIPLLTGILQATTAQKVEAYLKAKGLWTKEME
jgi:hypothetical protein